VLFIQCVCVQCVCSLGGALEFEGDCRHAPFVDTDMGWLRVVGSIKL